VIAESPPPQQYSGIRRSSSAPRRCSRRCSGSWAALEAAKRYLVSSASATFEEAFAVEHDKVFDDFLIGPAG
jgi:hypothetical protein